MSLFNMLTWPVGRNPDTSILALFWPIAAALERRRPARAEGSGPLSDGNEGSVRLDRIGPTGIYWAC